MPPFLWLNPPMLLSGENRMILALAGLSIVTIHSRKDRWQITDTRVMTIAELCTCRPNANCDVRINWWYKIVKWTKPCLTSYRSHWYFNCRCSVVRFLRWIFIRTWLRYVQVFAVAIPSVFLSSSVCRLYVTSVHHTQPVKIFDDISTPLTTVQNFTKIVPGEPLHRG